MQEAVLQQSAVHLDAVRQDETPYEAPGGDPPVQVGVALGGVLPAAGYSQLAVLQGDLQALGREPGHGEGDPEGAAAKILDIVRRIAFGCGLRRPLDLVSGMFEAEEEGAEPGLFSLITPSITANLSC
jgi:hypothetical protein